MTKYQISSLASINEKTYSINTLPEEIEYLETADICNNQIISTTILNKNVDKIPSRARRSIKKNSIIYSTVRPNLKHYGIILNPGKNLVVSTGFVTIDPNEQIIYPYYLFLKITEAKITEYLHQIAQTSVSSYPSISSTDIETLEIDVTHTLDEQRRIGIIFESIQQKISINTKIFIELESLAKTIYDYWFLQFEFPNEKGKPYRSSGGKMVWNEALKREVPEGWEVKPISDIVFSKRETISHLEIPENGKYVGLEHIPRKHVILEDYGSPEELESSKVIAKDGDILFGKIRPYFHKVSITPWDVYCSSDTLVFNSINEIEYAFSVFTLFSENFVTFATKCGNNGSKMPRAEWSSMKDYPVIMPLSKDTVVQFNELILPMINKMKELVKENRDLAALRDFLLPMLMNGQVTFKDEKECPA